MPFSALFMEYAIYLQRFHAGSAAELFEKFDGNSRPCFLAAIEKGRKDGSLGGSESAELLYGTVTDAIRGSCASFFLRNAGDLTTAKLRRLKAQLRHIADAFLAETQNKG
ncbi:MAG: hypothetical protein II689_00240 [Firmicutes bacterium]|nr:hypothetical protein [Bacillota bacterium]